LDSQKKPFSHQRPSTSARRTSLFGCRNLRACLVQMQQLAQRLPRLPRPPSYRADRNPTSEEESSEVSTLVLCCVWVVFFFGFLTYTALNQLATAAPPGTAGSLIGITVFNCALDILLCAGWITYFLAKRKLWQSCSFQPRTAKVLWLAFNLLLLGCIAVTSVQTPAKTSFASQGFFGITITLFYFNLQCTCLCAIIALVRSRGSAGADTAAAGEADSLQRNRTNLRDSRPGQLTVGPEVFTAHGLAAPTPSAAAPTYTPYVYQPKGHSTPKISAPTNDSVKRPGAPPTPQLPTYDDSIELPDSDVLAASETEARHEQPQGAVQPSALQSIV